MWCGTIGAWLLVGGPLYQGALELTDSADDAHFDDAIPQGREVAWWWWMVPPAAVLLLWIEERRFRRLWRSEWSADDKVAFVRFADRVRGWLIVSAGAFLLALEVTWYLTDQLGWPLWSFVLLVVGLALTCFVATAVSIGRHQRDARA